MLFALFSARFKLVFQQSVCMGRYGSRNKQWLLLSSTTVFL